MTADNPVAGAQQQQQQQQQQLMVNGGEVMNGVVAAQQQQQLVEMVPMEQQQQQLAAAQSVNGRRDAPSRFSSVWLSPLSFLILIVHMKSSQSCYLKLFVYFQALVRCKAP